MPQKTLRANWTRPLKPISSKAEFDRIQATDTVFPDNKRTLSIGRLVSTQKKPIFPAVTITKALTRCKRLSFLPANYFRMSMHCHSPYVEAYELTEQDLWFIKNYQGQNTGEVELSLNQQLMKKVIIFLEKTAPAKQQQKQEPIQTLWLAKLVKTTPFHKSQMSNIKKLQALLYNYWKQRRLDCQYPLYRPMWKCMNKQDLLLIYRPRTKKKNVVPVDFDLDKVVQQIGRQFQHASGFCNRIRCNQEKKVRKIQQEVEWFYQERKYLFSDEELTKLINLKELGINAKDNGGTVQHVQKQVCFKQIQKPTVDKFESIISFMATIISEIELSDIQFASIFPEQLSLDCLNSHKSYLSNQTYQQKRRLNCFYSEMPNQSQKSELINTNKQFGSTTAIRKT